MRRTGSNARLGLIAVLLAAAPVPVPAQQSPLRFETQEIDPHVGAVCYALATADLNNDQRPDIVAVTEDAVVWFENPSWTKHDIIRGATERDNVCIAPHDIDGDGQVDLALGAGWRPPDTANPSTLQWLGRDATGAWKLHPIASDEPSIHRIRWGDVNGDGTPELVVVPLQGRGTKGPDWGAGNGVRIRAFSIPAEPAQPHWPSELIDDTLHTAHNFQLVALDPDPALELIVASWEGVHSLDRGADGRWTRRKLGDGYQAAELPNKGASEIRLGLTAAPSPSPVIATIEPWHGRQVVLYGPGPDREAAPWTRSVLDDGVTWGHAVAFADLDGQPGDELIIGQRDPRTDAATPKGPGVWVYDLHAAKPGESPSPRTIVDDGGMACEDALAEDLDADGRPDLIAGGRATHNVRIYWNRTPAPAPAP